MKRKRLSETNQLAVAAYEDAAERIGNWDSFYACNALWAAAYGITPLPRIREYDEAFSGWFCPARRERAPGCGWWSDKSFGASERAQLLERTMRILALLLMAELVRDGQIDFDTQ